MSRETLEQSLADEVAQSLVTQVLSQPEQLRLFEADSRGFDQLMEGFKRRLVADNAGKLVLDAELVDAYRYKAAMFGAGFHATQFDDISYRETGVSGTEISMGVLGAMYVTSQIPERVFKHNRMWDEVENELFTSVVPSTTYDMTTGSYVTTPEDLFKIFKFDYEGLKACRDLDFDLLYERKD
jgi:hypothetical protein